MRLDKPILVGEDNPFHNPPTHDLWPFPPRCSGGRLAGILGLTPRQYLRTFDRMNLCRGRWNLAEARDTMHRLMRERNRIILLGSRVRYAFAMEDQPYFTSLTEGQPPTSFYVLPHPSGRCRIWNDPQAAGKARTLLREFL